MDERPWWSEGSGGRPGSGQPRPPAGYDDPRGEPGLRGPSPRGQSLRAQTRPRPSPVPRSTSAHRTGTTATAAANVGRSGRRASPRRRVPARQAENGERVRSALIGAKLVLVVVSMLVMGLTGYAWAKYQDLQNGLTTADVLGFNAPDGATDILLVGNDSRTDARGNPLPPEVLSQLRASDDEGGNLTDTMILVRIPNNGSKAVAISFPRDSYVELADGYGQHKLNSAYSRAKGETAAALVEEGADPATVERESTAAGRRLLVATIEQLAGVSIDHYAEVNLLGFSLLTQAVGGVPVCLKAPVDEELSGAEFPAGPQMISGVDALAFVRQRHGLPRGDIDRVVRQQAFIAGLAEKVLSSGTLTKPGRIRELIDATQQSVVLDKDWNVLSFAEQMQGIAAGDVRFVTIPIVGDTETYGEGMALAVDQEQIEQFVDAVIDPPPEAEPPPPADPANAAVTVSVFNTTGTQGLAGRVATALSGRGYNPGGVGNAKPRAASVIRHATGEAAAGERVADELGGLPVEEDETLPPGTLQVYLGEDYAGPGPQGFAAGPRVQLNGARAPAAAQLPPAPPPITASDVPCVD